MSAKRAPETTSLEARRRRVDSMLSGHLGLALLHKGDPEAKQRMLTPHEAELRAYVVAGVLSEADAEAWRARFAAAERAVTAPDSEVGDRATRTQATELLEELLKARTSDDEQTKASSFHSALGAFTAIGLISTEEQREWNERARPAPSPPRHHRLLDRPSYTAAELRTVLAGPLERLGGVRLLCAELYSDCVIVRWHRLLTPEEA
ncbi:MAG: hypothetical protein M3065_20410, partial [Actinomycetota bacterium]|nr:hypothetical protein [Actinomycetota bacterium]